MPKDVPRPVWRHLGPNFMPAKFFPQSWVETAHRPKSDFWIFGFWRNFAKNREKANPNLTLT